MRRKSILDTRCISSLEKILPGKAFKSRPFRKASALRNETFSFQIAYRYHGSESLTVKVESELADGITVRSVGLVPSELPVYPDHDDDILTASPGLFPDPLLPLAEIEPTGKQDGRRSAEWRSLWVTVFADVTVIPGKYPVRISFVAPSDEAFATETFELDILDAVLPEQTLVHTEWFHTDCLATHYAIDVFSEEHWRRIGQYVETAVRHGINMILTPLFTPPLDTAIGEERPTVQLVAVERKGNEYIFDFSALDRWVELCSGKGIQYFELSHLFTQWGAEHAPKIIALENGRHKPIFGWETDAAGDEYRHFLSCFLPELIRWIGQKGIKDRCYFHVSDEPQLAHEESYRKASLFMAKFVSDFPVIDALSDFEFYDKGLVKHPVPANNFIEPFLEHGVPDLWTYYCCGQYKKVSNRFFAFPSARNRIIGYQLYKFEISGFLHWGYNFWYTQFSKRAVDPFMTTDAGKAFPSGDAFLVYPGEEGPIESIRLKVFHDALQDLRALQLLESYIGREQVIGMIEEDLESPLTFTHYQRSAEWLLKKRERINKAIGEMAGK